MIEFTPSKRGFFKIMLKQPEKETVVSAAETLHLEIGVVRADGEGSMRNEMNHQLKFQKHQEGVHLDFSVLEFFVTADLVNQPLHIYFRSASR